MRKKPWLTFLVLMAAAPLGAQVADCPQSSAEQRRLAQELVQGDAARKTIAEGRTRVLHVYCAEPDKESKRPALIAVVYNYATNVAVRTTFDPASRQLVKGERMTTRPQSSAEEREEAFRIVREKADVGGNYVLEGGFVVDPPEAGHAGRYVQVQVLSPDRWKLIEFVTVDLSREVIAARRRP